MKKILVAMIISCAWSSLLFSGAPIKCTKSFPPTCYDADGKVISGSPVHEVIKHDASEIPVRCTNSYPPTCYNADGKVILPRGK